MEKHKSWAYEVYLDAVRDTRILAKFRATQQMSRSHWDTYVPHDVKQRFAGQMYVRVEPNVVYLAENGLSVLGYTEMGG